MKRKVLLLGASLLVVFSLTLACGGPDTTTVPVRDDGDHCAPQDHPAGDGSAGDRQTPVRRHYSRGRSSRSRSGTSSNWGRTPLTCRVTSISGMVTGREAQPGGTAPKSSPGWKAPTSLTST